MKRILTLIAIVVMTMTTWMTTSAEAQNKMFRKYGDMENVEYICITSPMLKMLGKSSATINGVHINGITDALKVILIINSEDKQVKKTMDEDFDKLRDKAEYDVLMEIKQNDEHIVTLLNSESEVKEIVMFIKDKQEDSRVFIVLTGKFTDEQIAKLLNN